MEGREAVADVENTPELRERGGVCFRGRESELVIVDLDVESVRHANSQSPKISRPVDDR
jgi:hypothetical protein